MPTLSVLLRKAIIAAVLVLTASFPCRAQTQASVQSPVRDTQAVATVQNALAAMGGQGVIAQVQSSVVQGTIVSAEGSYLPSGSFRWVTGGTQFRFESPTPNGPSILVTNGGNPQIFAEGNQSSIRPHMAMALFPV